MSLYDLRTEAQALPTSWRSRILGRVGATNLKVLRMDAHSVAEEVHVYDEGLLVIDGRLELSVQEKKSPSRPASFISPKREFLIR